MKFLNDLKSFLKFTHKRYNIDLVDNHLTIMGEEQLAKLVASFEEHRGEKSKGVAIGVWEAFGNTVHYDGEVAFDLDSGDEIPIQVLPAMGTFIRPFDENGE